MSNPSWSSRMQHRWPFGATARHAYRYRFEHSRGRDEEHECKGPQHPKSIVSIKGFFPYHPPIPSTLTYAELRQSEPKNESSLEDEIEGNEREEDITKEFKELYKANNSPISKPLLIVRSLWRFDSLERRVGYIDSISKRSYSKRVYDPTHTYLDKPMKQCWSKVGQQCWRKSW